MDAAREAALRDDLTGALNRRYLRELFEEEWPALVERSGSVAVLLLDLDRFKEINDRFGHLVGDRVLRRAAERIRAHFRDEDRLVRCGGDEFVVVLPGVDADAARALAERVRRALASEPWHDPATDRSLGRAVTFSIGAAGSPADGRTGDAALAVADRRLYEDKKRTRERRGVRRAVVFSAVVMAVSLALGAALQRFAGRPPQAPEVGAPPPKAATAEVVSEGIEALRREVEELETTLAAERSEAGREEYEARIAELEATLAEARRRAEARSAAPARIEIDREPVAGGAPAPGTRPRLDLPPRPPPAAGRRELRPPPPGLLPRPPDGGRPGPARRPPELVRHEEPVYPLAARRRRLSGTVTFRLWVTEAGRVSAVEQIGPRLGLGLDEAARQAALTACYRPATSGSRPVVGEATLQFRFVIED